MGKKTAHVLYNGYHFDPYRELAPPADSGVSSPTDLTDAEDQGERKPTPPGIEDTTASSDDGERETSTERDINQSGEDSGLDMDPALGQRVQFSVRKILDDAVPKTCPCKIKRECDLTDGDRALSPNTGDKIDQLAPVVLANSTPGRLWILGGAPRDRTMEVLMLTPTILENFPEIMTVDPRFTATDRSRGM